MSIWLPEIPTLTRRNLLTVGAVAISGFDLLPMLRPLNATVTKRMERACLSAAITFGLLPDVEMAMTTSPGLPSASI